MIYLIHILLIDLHIDFKQDSVTDIGMLNEYIYPDIKHLVEHFNQK